MRSERNRYNKRKGGVEMRNMVRQWVREIEKAELAEEKVIQGRNSVQIDSEPVLNRNGLVLWIKTVFCESSFLN